jgi:hypothetical protein
MAAAGFGLKLHDLRHGTSYHDVYEPWWQFARREYLGLDGDEVPPLVTFYYDPLLDIHHRLPVRTALSTAYYATPQAPDDARRLSAAASANAGLRRADPDLSHPRFTCHALFLAREWGDGETAGRLAAAMEEHYEPTWDAATGEFTWGFGLNERYPRGQFNAAAAAAEAVTEGAWRRFGRQRLPDGPGLVRGVDFPAVALSEARWVDGTLWVRLSPQTPEVTGARTSFEVSGLPQPASWYVVGPPDASVDVTASGALRVVTTVGPEPLAIARR